MPSDQLHDFIVAACVPLGSGHSSGTLDRADEILAAQPDLPSRHIYAAAIVGDDAAVHRFLAEDRTQATTKGGPHGWDALTYLCFSRYLRLDPARSTGLVRTARILLDGGASANTGFFSNEHLPQPEFESVLYGAAGVAHHADITRLLLERGADPNDGEVCYHAPETYDNSALKLVVETGRLTPDNLAAMLLRKADWHDYEGAVWLLEHAADPNWMTYWGFTALHQSVRRDNALKIVESMLDHGADPLLPSRHEGKSAASLAARRGRADVLEALERRRVPLRFDGVEQLIAACARNQSQTVHTLAKSEPAILRQLLAQGGRLLAEFAGNGNTEGVRHFLDLGVEIQALYEEGDGYFDVAKNSTALHVAAWRARHGTVNFLIQRGAAVDAVDGRHRTPLQLAVRACVDSYWKDRRSPESVRALLAAGASRDGVPFPSGYAEVDALLSV